jgi:hypothetical protein
MTQPESIPAIKCEKCGQSHYYPLKTHNPNRFWWCPTPDCGRIIAINTAPLTPTHLPDLWKDTTVYSVGFNCPDCKAQLWLFLAKLILEDLSQISRAAVEQGVTLPCTCGKTPQVPRGALPRLEFTARPKFWVWSEGTEPLDPATYKRGQADLCRYHVGDPRDGSISIVKTEGTADCTVTPSPERAIENWFERHPDQKPSSTPYVSEIELRGGPAD